MVSIRSAEDTALRVGVLASGNGTNLQAILDACAAGEIRAKVACVLSDQPAARALARAAQAGVPHHAVPRSDYASREDHDRALVEMLRTYEVELVVLAGYMRLVGQPFLEAYPQRIINVHPSLLPAFPGLNAQQQAWEYGVKVTGCTVHFVDEGLDTGPIILQESLSVEEFASLDQLTEGIHRLEHRLLPQAIGLFAEGKLRLEGRRVALLP